MTGKQQNLMPLRGIVNNTLHLLEAVCIRVDQCVIEDDERWLAGFLEQVSIGKSADKAQLLTGTITELVNSFRKIVSQQLVGQKFFVNLHSCIIKQQREIMVKALLQWFL